ncbi:hypothetical protein CSAL01_07343 [Colletotrichum salicis]|uniref:Uncharacterized protein n=1 Tax=Colletotrichum salicis TaxID=1209931 RepID=A0A135TP86_9PEZI|nr:hypothetical protein CSAL01_07343 [Colletotrichum salicis]
MLREEEPRRTAQSRPHTDGQRRSNYDTRPAALDLKLEPFVGASLQVHRDSDDWFILSFASFSIPFHPALAATALAVSVSYASSTTTSLKHKMRVLAGQEIISSVAPLPWRLWTGDDEQRTGNL